MKKSDFFYELPHELIAQHPTERRDGSRLLCLDRLSGAIHDKTFDCFPELLNEGDVLVLNNSRVLPARLLGKKPSGGSAEILLLKSVGDDVWECLVKPGKRLRNGEKVLFENLTATIQDELVDGKRLVHFDYDHKLTFIEIIEQIGQMPTPPYITEKLADKSRYQTVYANEEGSAAAPTAGLHFTDKLLDHITSRGVEIVKITLHVGLGTFRPVKDDNISDHIMHSEQYCVSKEAADSLNLAKKEGRRIVAVGTTSCRTLESVFSKYGEFRAETATTSIFIYPPYKFGAIDALLTNFHLPESTLIMLVSAFAGYENTMNAYKHAVEAKYRFFSFGDAMFIG